MAEFKRSRRAPWRKYGGIEANFCKQHQASKSLKELSTCCLDYKGCYQEYCQSDRPNFGYQYECLFDCYLNGKFCDAILRTEDRGCFPIHRIVLSAESDYFKALFTSAINSEPMNDAVIGLISAENLEICILYAYTQTVCLDNDNIVEILRSSDYLGIIALKNLCVKYIKNRIDIDNCFGIRNLANNYFCMDLEKTAYKFILKNIEEIAHKSEAFLEVPLIEIIEILNSEELNAKSEELVWFALVRWISHDQKCRKKHISELLPTVRTGLLSIPFFIENVKNHPFVAGNKAVRPMLVKTLQFFYDLDVVTPLGTKRIFLKETAPLIAKPRIPHQVLFAIGGWSGGGATDCIEVYDTRADRWKNVSEVDPFGPRAYHGSVALGHEIFIIGGYDGVKHFNSARSFNVVTKKWRNLAPMSHRRCYVAVVVLENEIFAIGGFDGYSRLNCCECYNQEHNQWLPIESMTEKRSDASAAVLNGKIYICGGFNGFECLQSVEMYDPETKQWSMITPMQYCRSGLAIVSHKGYIFALGGFNGFSRLISGEKYDPVTNSWSKISDLYLGRSNFAAGVIDDLIFVVGGFDGEGATRHVECYNSNKNEWLEASDMQVFRSALSCCVISDIENIYDYVEDREKFMEDWQQKISINHLNDSK